MAPAWLPFGRQARIRRLERDLETRDIFQGGARIPSWGEISGGYTYTGTPVTIETAAGLPAVGAAIRLLCDTVAQLPLNVYRGVGAEKRLADTTWQHRLLTQLPGMGDFTPFDLLSDIVACLETQGNAYLQKVKAAGEVVALIVIDPRRVNVRRDNGDKVFDVRGDRPGESSQTYTASTILHIRGFTLEGSDTGLSPIGLHRQKLSSIQAQDEFQGRFYGQGTLIGGVIQIPDFVTDEQAKAILAHWQATKSGLANAHLPALLQNGATFQRTGLSLEDSQFVETERLGLLQVAHIFRIPPSFLGADNAAVSFEQDNLRFYTLSLAPRLRRIELALRADPDLFPDTFLYPEFDTRPLLRTDAMTKAQVEHLQIQDGSRLVDEVRADRGEPPLPPVPDNPNEQPGMVPQVTPVGGAPNPNTTTDMGGGAGG